jgi:hypothetical protein
MLTTSHSTTRSHSESGFSLVESIVAMGLMVIVTVAVFDLANPATTTSQTQPEVVDMQQRARVASDMLFRDLFMAGAGVYSGPQTGSLNSFFAPVIPRKMGRLSYDNWDVARQDAVTITYIPNTYSQTTIRDAMPHPSAELKVEPMPNCPVNDKLCGFKKDMTLLIFDKEGHFDFFTVTEVQIDSAHLQHNQGMLSYPYQPGAIVTQAEMHTYYFDANAKQLRHYDGADRDVPVVDNVTGIIFEYFGTAEPPRAPKPPAGIANCLYDAAGNVLPGMPTLPTEGGSLATLPLSILNDGPWCGDGQNKYDADLLRVRKVRVAVRVETGQDQFRGTGADFSTSGTAKSALRYLPDYSLRLEVSPRNMNLGR